MSHRRSGLFFSAGGLQGSKALAGHDVIHIGLVVVWARLQIAEPPRLFGDALQAKAGRALGERSVMDFDSHA